ncbi:MAG: redox-regulated ATPase YchF [Phycisphaerae bacterium]|nr:redox-regulated ATPase YchF [Phycisphaerae bacterium]
MECGIVGLPNVGKSTLFNALTCAGIEAQNYPFCTIEPNVGAVSVPDPRLEIIRKHIESQKIIPAILKLVDIAGLVKGASEGQGLGNKFLSHIREVDAILHVVRCFEDPDIVHVDGTVDPIRDIETIETELMLADLQVIDGVLDKAARIARSGDKEAIAKVDALNKVKPALEAGRPVRSVQLDPEERKILTSVGMITAKPVLYVANVMDNDLEGKGPLVQKVRDYTNTHGGEVVVVCAKIESELAELPEADRRELLESLGMTEPALASVARAAYHLLGLQSYYTAGPKEIRAWTIHKGDTAPQAAGVIHTDFEKGFIRAECYSVDDLVKFKSEKAIREAGKMRSEGKGYVMHDADVVHFLFNV